MKKHNANWLHNPTSKQKIEARINDTIKTHTQVPLTTWMWHLKGTGLR